MPWLAAHTELLVFIEPVGRHSPELTTPAVALLAAVATAPGGLAAIGAAAPAALPNLVALACR